MPMPNFHSFRVREPSDFAKRQDGSEHIVMLDETPNGIQIYGGPLASDPSGPTKAQTYRFPRSKFTFEEAKKWMADHNIKHIGAEEATGKGASMNQFSVYALDAESVFCLAVGDRTIVNGVVHQRLKKDAVHCGKYIHPIEKWELDVTPEMIYQFKSAFDKMKLNGVVVETPVDHSPSAKDNLGYVVDAVVEPDENGLPCFYSIHDIIGEDSIGTCQKCPRVSPMIHKDYVDGKGNRYGEAIVHVSVCQQPIIPGQGDFIPVKIAASMFGTGASKIPVLYLNLQGEQVMDKTFLAKFGELLGATDVTEQNLVEKVGDKIKTLSQQITTLTEDIKKLSAKSDDKKADDKKIDPNIVEPLATMAEQKLSMLVEKGKITPAVKKELSEILVGAAGNRNILTLSFGDKGKQSLLFQLCDALDKNDVIQLGMKTGIQSFERPVDDNKAKEVSDTTKHIVEQVQPAVK